MKNLILILSFLFIDLSSQAEWKPYVHEDEDPQQEENPNVLPEPHLLSVEGAVSLDNPYSISPLPEDPQYISEQFEEEFSDPQKCYSYCPENRPLQMRRFKDSLQRVFDEHERTDMYFKNLTSCFEYNPENPDFIRISSCYIYTLNIGDTQLHLMPPQTTDDYIYEANCKTINMDRCPSEILQNALMAIKRFSNLHLVIYNFKSEAIEKAKFLVNHGLPKEVRFINGDLIENLAIASILICHVTRVVLDVDKLGTTTLAILCIRGLKKLDITFNTLIKESHDPIYLSELCENFRISYNGNSTIHPEKTTIVLMEDSYPKKKKEIRCDTKYMSLIPEHSLQVANLTLAFEDEECVYSILKNTLKVKNLKLILQSINTTLEFLIHPHLRVSMVQMELIVKQPYSGQQSEVQKIIEFYEKIKNISLRIDFVDTSSSFLSLEGVQERLNSLSLHSNTLKSEFPLNPEKSTHIQAIDMQYAEDSIATYSMPDFLARFESISDFIFDHVIDKKFWRKIEELGTVESLMIKNPIDQKIVSNQMAPLYKTMKKLTISLTPRALLSCKFALQSLKELNLSIVSEDTAIENSAIKEDFRKFCNNNFTPPVNLIRLNLNQNIDFNMIAICEYPFSELGNMNIQRCLYTKTGEENRLAENYFEKLKNWQNNREIHANIIFPSGRSYSNKNRF